MRAVGGAEFAQLLTADVMAVLTNGATRPVVRKKAALCLLRLIRKAPADADIMPASEWASRLAAMLEEQDPGFLLGLTTLLLGLVSRNYEGFDPCVPRLIRILERLKARDVPQDYTYFGLSSPWLQVRILRVLQYFPPPEDPTLATALIDTLKRILAGNDPVKNANKNNAVHAIVFEAAAVAVGMDDPELLTMAVGLLARFLTVREANLRYLALENMGRLAQAAQVADAVTRHQKTVVACLQDPDESIRRRALDLVFTTATIATAPSAVDELLNALPRADFGLREELVLKAAVLAERFPPSSEWYVDAMLRLLQEAGDAAVEDVWHSVVHLVAGEQGLQRHAAAGCVAGLRRGASTESFLRCAAFILGEYGSSLVPETPLSDQFALLHSKFPAASLDTKGVFLTAYEKMRAAAPADASLAASVAQVLERYTAAADPELQQRAVEYRGLATRPAASAVALAPLPPWEKRASLLLRRLAERQGEGEDESREQPAWMISAFGQQAVDEAATEAPTANGEQVQEAPVEAAPTPSTEPQVEVVKPPVPIPDLLDLLDLSEPPAAEEPGPSGPVAVDPALEVLGGLAAPSGRSANPFTGPGEGGPVRIEPTGDVGAWFATLCRGPSGILYEDANLQVGIKMSAQGSGAQLGIFLGNQSRGTLERIVCVIPPTPSFNFTMSEPPSFLERGLQVQITLLATCVVPSSRPPVLQLGYSLPGGMGTLARTLDLPLVPTKFCQPVDIPSTVFTTRWSQVVGAPFKLSQQVQSTASVQDVVGLLGDLQMRILSGVDDTLGIVCAACVFHCGAPPNSRQIPCMIKVEGVAPGGALISLTVATADAAATDALRGHLSQQLVAIGGK